MAALSRFHYSAVDILADVPISPNLAQGARDVTCCYPFPFRLANGDLLISYRQGKEKHSRDGRLMAQRSTDGGLTWSTPVAIYDGMRETPAESAHAGAVGQAADGTTLAVFTAVPAEKPDAYIFSAEGRTLRQQLYIAHSPDGGRTWSRPERHDLPGTPPNIYAGSQPLLLPNGELFIPLEATAEHGQEIALGTLTRDAGRTLGPVITCAADPSGKIGFGDPRCTLLPDGALVMLVWTYLSANEETLPVHRSTSTDGGHTWSAPAGTGVLSQIMTPLALDDQRMIAVSNVRTPPAGIRLWFSEDRGVSWNVTPIQMWDAQADRIQGTPLEAATAPAAQEKIWDALPNFTFGTPELLRLADNLFVLTYYAILDGITHVRACRFALR